MKPSKRATSTRSIGSVEPAIAPLPSGQTFTVAFEHLDVGEQMMREINGLRALQMRVAGNQHVGIFSAERDEGALQVGDFAEQRRDFVAQPEADVEGDLVVARAGSVQFSADGNALREFRLDVHVDVLEFGLPFEFAGADFQADFVQSARDGNLFRFGQHADFSQHGGVRERTQDVVPPEPPVEGNGFGELRDLGGGTATEAPAAGNGRFFIHGCHRANLRLNH